MIAHDDNIKNAAWAPKTEWEDAMLLFRLINLLRRFGVADKYHYTVVWGQSGKYTVVKSYEF